MTDVKNVVRRVKADLTMIADSTGAWTAQQAADYFHDIEVLAKAGYLAWVDLTLLQYGIEEGRQVQCRYRCRRPQHEPAWRRTLAPPGRSDAADHHQLHEAYTDEERRAISGKLKIGWTTSYDDNSHSGLSSSGGRNYVSSMQRKDWAA